MEISFALLPSPFLGPAVWEPVRAVLTRRGVRALVPAPTPERIASPADVLQWFSSALPETEPPPEAGAEARDVILVPHSNAGLYVAALAARHPLRGVVFVDALIPPEGQAAPVAPPAVLGFLRELADSAGLLPPWTGWWDEQDVEPLFPDPDVRRVVEREQRRLPLSYVEAAVPTPPGWQVLPAAYLAFGETYGEERERASLHGWPVETLDGHHLHMLRAPEQVAETLLTLASALPSAG